MTGKDNGLVVKIGAQHNRWVVLLTEYEGPPCICPQFLTRLHSRLQELHGDFAVKVSSLDYIEILGRV